MLNQFLKTSEPAQNRGAPYISFLAFLHDTLAPRSYFEIGTATGASLSVSNCPSVCVDPNFQIAGNVTKARVETFLLQVGSDDFFRQYDLNRYLPHGVDLAFLDGMHLYEFLYRDLMNTEKCCHARSLIAMHDCLPLDTRMAQRKYVPGAPSDPYRDAWTGDVWKLLPALKKYRPDLRILLADCPPTGLVLITKTDPSSRVLDSRYSAIINEFKNLDLSEYSFERLYREFPTLDTHKLMQTPAAAAAIFGFR